MPKLIIQVGPNPGAEFPFDRTLVIGRGAEADVVLADRGVSRRHARFTWSDGQCVVEDLGSANGTVVNGRAISAPVRLSDGDTIEVGPMSATYRERDQEPPAATTVVEPGADGPVAPQVVFRLPADDAPSAPGAASAAARPLRFLEDFGRISSLVFDETALLSFVADELFQLIPSAGRALVMLWDSRREQFVSNTTRARAGGSAGTLVSQTLLTDVKARREAVLAVDLQADTRFAQAESVQALGIRAVICAPMIFQNEVYGILQVDNTAGGAAFDRSEVALTLSLASQIAMALGFARLHATLVDQELLHRDMALAKKVQQHFLPPEPPAVPGYACAVDYRPALAVGGDFYDFIDLGGGRLAIVVGDASGKGVSAALYAAKVSSDLRYQAVGQTRPSAILDRANRALAGRDHEGMFATAAVCVLEPARGRLTVASAGHPLPIVRGADGEVVKLGRVGDVPLGLQEDATFEAYEYEFEPGDSVVFYTDGVSEGLNERQELFGEARLTAAVRGANGTLVDLMARIQADLRTFVGSVPQSDDITVVCVRRDTKT